MYTVFIFFAAHALMVVFQNDEINCFLELKLMRGSQKS